MAGSSRLRWGNAAKAAHSGARELHYALHAANGLSDNFPSGVVKILQFHPLNWPLATVKFSQNGIKGVANYLGDNSALARALSMSASDYVREAVREKNERAIKDRMVFLSRQLSAMHLAENVSTDGSSGDGLGQS